MNHAFHRHSKAVPIVAQRGEGPCIYDAEGRRYLDASGGAAVSCLGHDNRRVIDAVKSQLDEIPYAHTSFFTTRALEKLADALCERAPEGIGRAWFASGGSEAIEAALKLARQYFLERGEAERSLFIARRQSYHGNTLGALAVGGNRWRRAQFHPLLMPTHHISPCYAYRDRREDESEFEYGQRVADELERKLLEVGAERVIAFVAEPVVGATAGALAPVPGYFRRIREICDRYGILLILDEVMCGMGRTGSLFACEQDGVSGDLIAVAKGLAAGYQPLGAVLASDRIFDAVRDGSGFFQHGHTFMGHACACAAAVATIDEIERRNLLDNVRRRGEQLREGLRERFAEHPHVGDVRGRGLFIGLELVRDRETREPFDPSIPLHDSIKSAALENGLICYPSGGTIDGRRGHHVLLAPPYVIDESHVAEIIDKLSVAIPEALARHGEAG